ncbi:MAG: glutamine synthetase III [Bacteroidales bacterium]|nr:glutamine synthetase III [Bacteroidales bacterium]
MTSIRFIALEKMMDRQEKEVHFPSLKVSDYFGSMTFNQSVMKEYLTEEAFDAVMKAIDKGERIDRKVSDQVASAMKAWAMNKGATHYTHWFHPLTGATAEKHDAFINPVGDGTAIEHFQGGQLVQQEPDASSFPSGGIRSTFEARGYTAWDPTSPAFILDKTLCIPTIFVSYTGESLDYKTPLLKSIAALDAAAVPVCQYFNRKVNKIYPTLGWEQEYFLVDEALFVARPDMVLTGKTVFGHASAKDQQLEDHYFGTINNRAKYFMHDLEIESHKLGIPLKTRHNEVAPSQFECAPVFEEVNVAVDHNQLLMHMMEKVARRHHFKVLLHEKPYAGINGSGKHNNWSMATDNGINLLSPGKTAEDNFRFVTMLSIILKGIHSHEELLRASIASEGNDLRLGANEAPPAIISAFLGKEVTATLEEIEKMPVRKAMNGNNGHNVIKHIPKVPEILLDNTDRNRTSPFAFTGNKFEFRAVGSTANTAFPMFVLNAIIAEQMSLFKGAVDANIEKGMSKEDAIFNVVKSYIIDSKPIRFEGNSYSDEWVKEAAKRGLSNNRSTPDALPAFVSESSVALFEKHDIMNKTEVEARYEIMLENYIKKVQIEGRVLGDLAINHILPTAIHYQNRLVDNVKGLKEVLDEATFKDISAGQVASVKEISVHIQQIKVQVEAMIEARKKANNMDSNTAKARAYREEVMPFFEVIRMHVDKLELMVDDELWPLPKYRELLFMK